MFLLFLVRGLDTKLDVSSAFTLTKVDDVVSPFFSFSVR